MRQRGMTLVCRFVVATIVVVPGQARVVGRASAVTRVLHTAPLPTALHTQSFSSYTSNVILFTGDRGVNPRPKKGNCIVKTRRRQGWYLFPAFPR